MTSGFSANRIPLLAALSDEEADSAGPVGVGSAANDNDDDDDDDDDDADAVDAAMERVYLHPLQMFKLSQWRLREYGAAFGIRSAGAQNPEGRRQADGAGWRPLSSLVSFDNKLKLNRARPPHIVETIVEPCSFATGPARVVVAANATNWFSHYVQRATTTHCHSTPMH
jgi:hypothetical protein